MTMQVREILNAIDVLLEEKAKYTQITLPYGRTDLKPVMSKDTLDYHYKLYKGYVDKANRSKGGDFQIAGAFLHSLYFAQFKKPSSSNKPTDSALELINSKHGTFDKFQTKFEETAMAIEGSGWVYMDTSGNIKTIHHHKKINNIALVVDWWEHSWALDYKADKASYIMNTWRIINWGVINDRINSSA